ncbi:MAG: hypothetical protein HC890_08760 [Chloroflexaceae bacterium]|nr:hypothetical protein [Chloroflexaceae bacterium]
MANSLHRPAWSQAIAEPAAEFPLTSLKILAGTIPEQLRGTLYRNGPGRLQRGGQQAGHWFDGDGAVLAVHFSETGATATYRYVQTAGYQQESAADAYLFPNYGMTAPGPFWNSWGKDPKNAANTSVLPLPDKLLALWEGGHPHALDLHDLRTLGGDRLSGLTKKAPYSAHPKIDCGTGKIYNFGVELGLQTKINLYQSDETGKIQQQGQIPLSEPSIIHDFSLAGPYLVLLVPPVRLNLLRILAGFSCFSGSATWKPELGTEIIIVDAHSLTPIARAETDPWYQWHFANGYGAGEEIVIEIVRYSDFPTTNQNLDEISHGYLKTPALGLLWRLRLDARTGKLLEQSQICDRACEFPVVPRHQVGQSWRNTYMTVHRDNREAEGELFGAIGRYDRQTEQLILADMGEGCYPSEPIFAPAAAYSEEGWILTVVYDGNQNRSELRIYDARLETELCRLELPRVIPHSFHGAWKPA